ncbi:MAG: pyridoxine 5'-phosphate synthase, partial [Mariprofundales bacterium]|nr:pyridoxine 5'-phosphate synthase [Mariprofundales bacterium]
IHLREDRRHIQDRDLRVMRETVQVPLNLEMAVTEEMIGIALAHPPYTVTLVPEKREELTTEGGLDVVLHQPRLSSVVKLLSDHGITVSLFIDPDPDQIHASHAIGAPVVELHTGHYANLQGSAQQRELLRIQNGAQLAAELGLTVHAGHGLTCGNTPAIAAIEEIVELNIGHAIVSDAVMVGLAQSIAAFRRAMVR